MSKTLHVIHIEDSLDDSFLVEKMLKKDGIECEIRRVETRAQLMDALHQSKCDLILSDCTLPQFHGLEALEVVRKTSPETPFIFISGTIGEEVAINSLQNGATDYVLKHRLTRLVPAVRRALADAEERVARVALEDQLRQARKLESLGTSIGGLAHDFRNVLHALRLNLDLLPLLAHDPQAIADTAERMKQANDHGCRMVEEILLFARKPDSHPAAFDMSAQVEQTLEFLLTGLPSNISLSLFLAKNLPAVMADAGHVDRILTNLISNARDALPEGGGIMISAALTRFDHASIETWRIKDVPYLRVTVSDSGIGMDEATQSRIFEPFFTTKPVGKGTGLGLSVVFGLMDANQGFIDLESKVGEGTTFSLFFSLAEETAAEGIPRVAPTRLVGKMHSMSENHC